MSASFARCVKPVATILVSVSVLMAGNLLAGQTASPTDIQFHKFQPAVSPEEATSGAPSQGTLSNGIGVTAAQQMMALQREKNSRTPAQQKIDSNVLYTIRMLGGKPAAPGVSYLYTGVDLDASDNIVVDMVANVTDTLLEKITTSGGQVLYVNRALRSIRAIIPPEQIREYRRVTRRDLHFTQARLHDSGRTGSWAHQSDAALGSGARLRTESSESSPRTGEKHVFSRGAENRSGQRRNGR